MKCVAKQKHADEFDESYSLTHLAHRWGVSRRNIRQLLQTGELPFVEIDGQLRVPASVVRIIELGEKAEQGYHHL